ncbi:zinc finger protein 576-like isoform X2 [Rhineura floridana]|nr:zinc finger protein 576-like isoform X2 [Rhineura floridana]XP_061453176.1 zinc finger protein 576-like isoform X2 [Rhineura floridana]XP_061453177.1 zinc finger protein 576-like isoform X2 [Rhineura floridana]XP_061453178.1 zinc finger protein 576-like isoform X2 [Rhineura floridana]
MAEPSTVSKPLLTEQLLTKVSDFNGLDVSAPQEHLPICKSEPICVEEEESPTAVPPVCPSTHGKGKESPSNSAIYSLGANQCFHCLITFPDEKFKERHMKREHPEDFVQANLRDALFVCFICNKAFESSRALICHQRGHAPAPPSDCTDCLRPTFDCPDCGRRFGQLANYQRHRLGHAAGHSLPHQCPDCGKSFRQLSNLRRHQAFHQQTQELLPSRPYSCMECGESFNQEAGLHEHYIRHARGEL